MEKVLCFFFFPHKLQHGGDFWGNKVNFLVTMKPTKMMHNY